MSDTKLTYELDGSGRITVRATNEGVLLTKEEAERVAADIAKQRERIAELEELVRDMWFWGYEGHMDSESQDWQMKHIDGVLDRMKELGIEVIDE